MNRVSLLLSAALLVSGCASLDLPRDVEGSIAQQSQAALITQQNTITPDQWMASVREGDSAVSGQWSALFGPELDVLIDEALASNYTLAISQETVTRAEALLRQSRSSRLPSISGSGSLNQRNPVEGFPSTSFSDGVSASYDLDLRGSIAADIADSAAALEASKATFQAARQSIAALTATAWFDAIEAQLQLDLAQDTLVAVDETHRIVSVRFDEGYSSYRDAVLSESDRSSARDSVVNAQASLRSAKRALEVLLGRYPGADITVPASLPPLPARFDAGLPADILRRRPDLIAAEYDVISSYAGLIRTKADRWPSISLSAGLSGGGGDLLDLIDPANLALATGARLAAALFDGGLRQAQIEASESAARTSVARYGQSVIDAYADVEQNLDDIQTLTDRQTHLRVSMESAQESLRLTELRYAEGDTDLLDVLNLRQRAYTAQRSLISNLRSQLSARVRLYRALGGVI